MGVGLGGYCRGGVCVGWPRVSAQGQEVVLGSQGSVPGDQGLCPVARDLCWGPGLVPRGQCWVAQAGAARAGGPCWGI